MQCLNDSEDSSNVANPKRKMILFLCTAHVLTVDSMLSAQMLLRDFPLHDSARELLFMSWNNSLQKQLLSRLERVSAELAEEQARSDELLYSMLPQTVVADLRDGRRVRGREYEAVTLLFSDIIGFTDMSRQCKPAQVCHLLDELYTVFDTMSTFFDVYKVETIGDAYMIAGGITGDPTKHATAVADMAFAMHAGAKLIRSPNLGQPVQIRVGMHTGPVMTGVVGIKMPRYCFFGDTVNTASRMESNGLAGLIHCSESCKMELEARGYKVEFRSNLEIKGKGAMPTYWVTEVPRKSAKIISRALKKAEKALADLIKCRWSDTGESSEDPSTGERYFPPRHSPLRRESDSYAIKVCGVAGESASWREPNPRLKN
jgi:guanylate cyclase soluble subunit beta